ncbi:MAG TPA: 23S rRNA (adenine(2503)-C(2))-methyltransferase RlmN [Bacteroidales bacterium]|nr:MAG: 23S rRNA (adenine(2503)-C(2))-methyltransferase [Bacteroidetes bacterium GWE2_42_24]OFY29545.1 MAG: 23S rRNA (adenine(2503)-C(2))-methyltransferase [Bacteroidetes bacterium GWF2_43_11]HAQ64750.1 23S rRNA (adenine(2503)-C(2))-methyltransferase RlmN [Bacteroidales bacterium]HBZ67348.1 23S rRNA (adenine(2503)-C(2))-methyltransferase RlmN [Bacteroidales bacterium]
MESLFGKTLAQLTQIAINNGLPKFTGRQMAEWLYKKQIANISDMTNIAKQGRERLEVKYTVGLTPPIKVQTSTDGTKKYLYTHGSRGFIEAAYIPDDDRATLCVSSQVGCKMGCLFCMTGKQGFQTHLTAGEILNQIRSLPERDQLTNVVYMGMGEPLDNPDEVLQSLEVLTAGWGYAWSPKRITVSTIGIIPAMKRFLSESDCHLAISLHTPFEDERRKLMPIENVYHLHDVIDAVKEWDWTHQRRISFEYIVFGGLNDTPRHVNELVRILNGIKCRINLIRFHPIPDTPLHGTDEATLQYFKTRLNEKGVLCTIRASRGQDIYAACGLLSTKELMSHEQKDY